MPLVQSFPCFTRKRESIPFFSQIISPHKTIVLAVGFMSACILTQTFSLVFHRRYNWSTDYVLPLLTNQTRQEPLKNSMARLEPLKDYMTRNEALLVPICHDSKQSPDAGKSKLRLLSNSDIRLGGRISVAATLYNGYGRPVTTGGHQLRARMFNSELKAAAPGELVATREQHAVFVNNGVSETTACHVFPYKLTQYSSICNLTYENSGMAWYCGKPRNRNLQCVDWTYVKTGYPHKKLPITNAEKTLIKRAHAMISEEVTVVILEGTVPDQRVQATPSVPCSLYNNISSLWNRKDTTGFLYHDTWRLRHCQGTAPKTLMSCLANRTLILFGDSTSRDWFIHLQSRFNCQLITDKWKKRKWHRRSECLVKSINLTVQWLPHSQPFYPSGHNELIKDTLRSISRSIDEIKADEKVIVLIHLFMHMLSFEEDVFRAKIQLIRQSVENLIKRNAVARVLIKAPHTFTRSKAKLMALDDYFGYVYRTILIEEFAGLYDRVIYLDQKDSTVATNAGYNHTAGKRSCAPTGW